jgi:hypothetical protein
MNIQNWARTWKEEIISHKYLIIFSLIFLLVANILNFFASTYVDTIITSSVPDLILDIIPTVNLDFLFVYGMLAIILVIAIHVIFVHVKEFHTVVLQFSLLIMMRSFFITLTHIAQPADARIITSLPGILSLFTFRNDLFFSGHTAVPFLAFLLFRKEKIGIFFLIMTIVMAITVLFMHVHYSIDVFSAFFITFGTYKLGQYFCKKICT